MYARIDGKALFTGDRVSRDGEVGVITAMYGDEGGLTAESVKVEWDSGFAETCDPDELDAEE